MITPHKYLNLDLSVINVSALIIKQLKKHKLIKYDELLYLVISQLGKKTKEVFPYAINFLYLLDKIIYHDGELDAFELK
jgi:hypothetical protein